MKRKLVQKSSCVSDSEEYINSQPVAEPRAIPEERQRGTVILTRAGCAATPLLLKQRQSGQQSGQLLQPCLFYRTSVLPNKRSTELVFYI